MILINVKKRNRLHNLLKRLMAMAILVALVLLLLGLIHQRIIARHKDPSKEVSKPTKVEMQEDRVEKTPDKVNLKGGEAQNDPGPARTTEPSNTEQAKDYDNPIETNPDDEIEKRSPANYNEAFTDSVFLGDSITEGLSFYKFLDDSKVIAGKGLTASKAMGRIGDIIDQKPENIFILFGMNDISVSEDCNVFIRNYKSLIEALKEKLPDAKIYIHPIFPIESKADNKFPNLTNSNIEKFNVAIPPMTEEEDVFYIDILPLLNGPGKELFEADGMHFKYRFYNLWLDFIIDHYLN